MVICLEQGADLHMAQLMPLPLTVSCFSKIQIGFTILVPAHPGNPEKRAVKRVCVSPYSHTSPRWAMPIKFTFLDVEPTLENSFSLNVFFIHGIVLN